MNRIPLSPVNKRRATRSRRALSLAATSILLVTGFASSPAKANFQAPGETSAQGVGGGNGTTKTSRGQTVPRRFIATIHPNSSMTSAVATIGLANFNKRFGRSVDEYAIRSNELASDILRESKNNLPGLPGEAVVRANARRELTVRSPISVYSIVKEDADPVSEPHLAANIATLKTRTNLLSGVPEGYARLALKIAGEEGVDPNWVLSVMRAEDAGFNPRSVSSAGAVGLMQVLPRIGEAFGAKDLTDPEQNIRAGTRLLRTLIDKYRNPVVVAAAYNAGEPNVDLRHSFPLIRETGDYVTRVIGYYAGAAAGSQFPPANRSSSRGPGSVRRVGPAERAKSPMLVFSAAKPIPPNALPQVEDGPKDPVGPVKIVKEEVRE